MATGTTRFDKFLPRDYSMEWYVPKLAMPNFEAWDETLKTQQTNYDTGVALSEKMPKYLPTEYDEALRNEYKQNAATFVDDISKAYQEQGITAGNRLLRDRGRQLVKEWQPGGRAAALEDRYASYQAALKEIEEAYKKDPRGINKDFAKYQLEQQLKKDIGYDPETGKYSRIATPELHTDPNIQKLILESVTKIDKDGYTDILKRDAYWFEKVRKLERPEDKIRMVTEAILEQYPNQIIIEAWNKKRHLPEDKAKQIYDARLDQQYKSKEQLVESAKTMDKNKLKQLQSELVEQGYDVTIDGAYGPETEKALKEYLGKTKETIDKRKEEFKYDDFAVNEVTSEYINFAKGFATEDTDRDLIYNPVPLNLAKLANARAQTEALLGLTESLKPKPATNSLVLPDKAIDFGVFGERLQKNKEVKKEVETNINKALEQTTGVFKGWKVENVAEAYRIYEEIVKANPNATQAELQAKFAQDVRNNSSYDFKPEQLQQIYGAIAGEGETSPIKQMMGQLNEADGMVRMIEEQAEIIATTYLSTTEGKANLKKYDYLRKSGESDTAFAKRLISEKPSSTGGQGGTQGGGLVMSQDASTRFQTQMQADIEKQQKKGVVDYSTALNNYAVHFGENDDYFSPTIDILNDAMNTGNYFSFSSNGVAGLVFEDADGNKLKDNSELSRIKVTGGKVMQGPDGKTRYYALGISKDGAGKNPKPVMAPIDLIPGTPLAEVVRKGLIGTMAAQQEGGLPLGRDGVVQNLMALEGYSFEGAASKQTVAEKVTMNNTKVADDIYYAKERIDPVTKRPVYEAIPSSAFGQRVKHLGTTNFVDSQGNDRSYNTYVVLNDSGNKTYINTAIDRAGNEVVIPGENGNNYYDSALKAERDLYAKKYLDEVEVVRQTTTVKNAPVLNAAAQSALINANQMDLELDD